MKKAIYTVITNGYDDLKNPLIVSKGFDYICFTDDPTLTSSFWQIRYVDKQSRHLQREIKVLAHEYLPDYDVTIYVDGSMTIRNDISVLVKLMGAYDILFISHDKRRCVYEEEKAVLSLYKDDSSITAPQMAKYANEGMPMNFGMTQNGIVVRRNVKEVADFCNIWWSEIEQHSHRDQLSVTYSLWKTGLKAVKLNSNYMQKMVVINKHNYNYRPKNSELNIIYSTPARSDKNIGRAYNDFMSTVPDGSWVCLRDGDTMFTTPDWPKHIEDIIKENGSNFDLIGCMTNRLRGKHQLIDGMFDEPDISRHLEVAGEIRSNEVVKADGIAGLCLIFRKELWKTVKFTENSIYFDTQFCKSVKRIGGRIGVAKGLYLFHLYRWGQENPTNYVKHLV